LFFGLLYIYESERSKSKKTNPFYQIAPTQGERQNNPQKTQTQGDISMNINPEFNSKETPSAVGAMQTSMQWLWENFVEPRKHELDGDDADMLAMVGSVLLDIASDAEAYHKVQGEKFIESPYSRN
jgi:hypothetical protein